MKSLYLWDAEDHVSRSAIGNGTRAVAPETILLVVRGMILAKEVPIALARRELTFNQDLKAVLPKNGIDNRFLLYLLLGHRGDLLSIADEAAHGTKRLQTDRLLAIQVRVPPIEIQQRIATVLSAYDDLIENNTRRIAILEEIAQRIFEEWFVRFRAPGCEGAQMIDSPMGPIPEGWEVVLLSTVADVNPEQLSPKAPPERVSYIDIASVTRGSINQISPMPFANAPGRARRILRDGDTIWSCVRPNRRSHALVLDPSDDWTASTGFAVLRPRKISSVLLYLLTTTDEFVTYLANHATGAAYPAVKGEDFERAKVIRPPDKTVREFTELVEPAFRLVQVLSNQNHNLRAQRDLLLPKVISGEIDVSSARALKDAAE